MNTCPLSTDRATNGMCSRMRDQFGRWCSYAAVLAASVLLGACGGGKGEDPATAAPPPPPSAPANQAPTGVRLLEVASTRVGELTASWLQASDDRTPAANLRYQLHASTQEDFVPSPATLVAETVGALSATVSQVLLPGSRYHIRLVVLDLEGLAGFSTALPVAVADTAATLAAGVAAVPLSAAQVMAVAENSVTLAPGTAAPAVGSVIVSSEGLGFLRRVLASAPGGAGTVLTTEPAALADVFDEAQLSSAVRMSALPQVTQSATPGVTVSSLPLGGASWSWGESGFTYGAGTDIVASASERRRILRAGGLQGSQLPELGRIKNEIGSWGTVRIPESVLTSQQSEVTTYAYFEARDRSAPWFGSPVNLCKFEVVSVTNQGSGANTSALGVALDGRFDVNAYFADGRIEKAVQRIRITPSSDAASATPYRVRISVFLEDVENNCAPPGVSLTRPFGGWREVIDIDFLVFVGDVGLPSQEETNVELVPGVVTNFSIRNQVETTFDPTVIFEARLGRRALEYVRLEASASPTMIQQTLTIRADARRSVNNSIPLIQPRRFFKVFVTSAGIPVVLSGEFTLDLRVDGEITGALEAIERLRFGFEQLRYGIECTSLSDCRPISEQRPVVNLTIGGQGQAQAHLTLTVVPAVKLRLYETLGGQLTLDPQLTARAGIEGHVEFEADVDPYAGSVATTFDADYRLTAGRLDAGLSAWLYADLVVFDRTLGSWPSGARPEDYKTHREIPLFNSTLLGIPILEAAVDMDTVRPDDLGAIRVAFRSEDVRNPFRSLFPDAPEAFIRWLSWTPPKILAPIGVPQDSFGLRSPLESDPQALWLYMTKPGTYIVRVGGYSNMGRWARQYVDVEVTVTDANGNGILDHLETRSGAGAIDVAAASCTSPVVGEPMTCTVTGSNLPADIAFNASNCTPQPMNAVAGGSSTARAFTCTPLAVGVPVEVTYTVAGFGGALPSIATLPASGVELPISDVFAWPVDPTNPSRGHLGACDGQNGGCYWLSDASRDANTVWRDAQPFQQEVNIEVVPGAQRWHLGADYNLGSGVADHAKHVYAAADGEVAEVLLNQCGWGHVIMLRHRTTAGPVITVYAHVDWFDVPRPSKGDRVSRGTPIAQIGDGAWTSPPCASSGSYLGLGIPHLHFEIRLGSDIALGSGYTSVRLVGASLGPQGQTDPNTFIRERLAFAGSAAGRLNDTGIGANMCMVWGGALRNCTHLDAIGFNAQQDGMVGRDVTHPDPSDGRLGFSFSEVPRPGGGFYARTDCVLDNVTGLMWEGKTADGGLRDGSRTYTNLGNNLEGDASAYVAAANVMAICGYTDWRLPNWQELQSIVDYGRGWQAVAVDQDWFPNTVRGWYWTSSRTLSSISGSFSSPAFWIVDFADGVVRSSVLVGNTNNIRLVRSSDTRQ